MVRRRASAYPRKQSRARDVPSLPPPRSLNRLSVWPGLFELPPSCAHFSLSHTHHTPAFSTEGAQLHKHTAADLFLHALAAGAKIGPCYHPHQRKKGRPSGFSRAHKARHTHQTCSSALIARPLSRCNKDGDWRGKEVCSGRRTLTVRAACISPHWCTGWDPHSYWMTLASRSKNTLKASVLHEPSCCSVFSLFSWFHSTPLSLEEDYLVWWEKVTQALSIMTDRLENNAGKNTALTLLNTLDVPENFKPRGRSVNLRELRVKNEWSSMELCPQSSTLRGVKSFPG